MLFHNTSEVIRAEKVLRQAGFHVEVKGPPPELQSGCDMVLLFPLMMEMAIVKSLDDAMLTPLQVVPLSHTLLEPVSLFQSRYYDQYLMVRAANMKITVDSQSLCIVNISGGGCPDVPYLAAQLVGHDLHKVDAPRVHGHTLCSYALQKAYEEIIRQLDTGCHGEEGSSETGSTCVSVEEYGNIEESPWQPQSVDWEVRPLVSADEMLDVAGTHGLNIPHGPRPAHHAHTEALGADELPCPPCELPHMPVRVRPETEGRNTCSGAILSSQRSEPLAWLICGTLPMAEFPVVHGMWTFTGESLRHEDMVVPVQRGTTALLAAAALTCECLGCPPPDSLLVGDAGTGTGSRALYAYLAGILPHSRVQGITFHYLFPDIDGHNRVLLATQAMAEKPLLVADAGYMYVAKMSGYAEEYNLFTPDAGELAFLADEKAPHPFYTRGFLLAGGQNVADISAHIQRAYAHNDSAEWLLIKGEADHLAHHGRIVSTIKSPVVPNMEPIGGTGDLVTGMVTGLLACGFSMKEACLRAAYANRQIGLLAQPTPATQVYELLDYVQEALSVEFDEEFQRSLSEETEEAGESEK